MSEGETGKNKKKEKEKPVRGVNNCVEPLPKKEISALSTPSPHKNIVFVLLF